MDGRIGTLEVQYRTRGTDPLIAARLPAITRAIERDLAEALDARLTRALGSGRDVYVIRELTAATMLTTEGIALDARVIDQVCRSSVDALVDVLVKPHDDVVRFEDQADFLCAFVVDELSGLAADRWYFGAFRRFRQVDTRRTIEAVLAAHPEAVATILGRLARRGRLEDLLTLLEPSRLLQLAGEGSSARSTGSDVSVLVDAALHLTALAGWEIDDALRVILRQALLMKTTGQQPAWTDTRALSMFVWACIREAAAMLSARGVGRSRSDSDAIDRALSGPLDWLDGPWLIDQLTSIDSLPAEARERFSSRNPIDVVVERISLAIAGRRVGLRESDSDDALVARLIAAGQIEANEVSIVPALRQVLERAVREWRRQRSIGVAGAQIDDARSMSLTPSDRHENRPRVRKTVGAVEQLLVNALVSQSTKLDDKGEPTSGASLYLLSRALLDTGLWGLATAHDVPAAALLSGLAAKWLALDWPLDGPAHVWTGASSEEETLPSLLDGRVSELAALEESLRTRLRDQQLLNGDTEQVPEAVAPDAESVGPWSPDVSASLDRLSALLLRAWSRWLPGLAGSSPQFLLKQCLRRDGTVRMTPTSVTVTLEPAPLDVLLEMAGYLRPIEMLPWLAGRSVTFVAAARRPAA